MTHAIPMHATPRSAAWRLSTVFVLIGTGKEGDARGISMKEIFRPDRANFPLRKKPRDRDGANALLDHLAVMVAVAE